jgi:hypothetical protein
LVGLPVFSQTGSQVITVFVTPDNEPDPSGFIAPGAKDRSDSARDIQNRISGRKQGVELRLVSLRGDADVIVAVTGREAVGENRRVSVRLRVGQSAADVVGTNNDSEWRAAASDAVKRIAEWIRDNRPRIIESRQTRRPR